MRRPLIRLATAAGLLAAFTALPGCQDDQSEAAKAAANALGVEDTEAKTEPRDLVVRDIQEVIDPETDKVLSKEVKDTPVEVQVKVNKDVQVNTGETHAASEPGGE